LGKAVMFRSRGNKGEVEKERRRSSQKKCGGPGKGLAPSRQKTHEVPTSEPSSSY